MPSTLDWRSNSTAEKLMQLDQHELAVEFLRRNVVYAEDYRVTQMQIALGRTAHELGMARLAQRWGLSFPACTQHACLGFARIVAARTFSCHCHRCRST